MTKDKFLNQKTFWNKMQNLKYDIIYYTLHFNRCVKISKTIKYIVIFLTALSFGLLMTFSFLKAILYVCGILGIVLQIFNAVSDELPFELRKNDLREMSNKLDALYHEMEMDWLKIANAEIYYEEIESKIKDYGVRQREIQNNYLKNDFLPEKEKIKNLADIKLEEYFKNLLKETNNE